MRHQGEFSTSLESSFELRLKNYAERDEDENLPWSIKELRACYKVAAERFGWERAPAAASAWRFWRKFTGTFALAAS